VRAHVAWAILAIVAREAVPATGLTALLAFLTAALDREADAEVRAELRAAVSIAEHQTASP